MLYSYDQFIQCWINKPEDLPDICCVCGMHTDQRGKLKQEIYVHEQVPSGSMGSCLVSILLMMLGPLGWIIGLLKGRDRPEGRQIVTKKKFSYTLSLCPICVSEYPPKVEQVSADQQRFLIHAHPKFKQHLDELRQS